jgi:hypothetical protein
MAHGPWVQAPHFAFHWATIAAAAVLPGSSFVGAGIAVAVVAQATTAAIAAWFLHSSVPPDERPRWWTQSAVGAALAVLFAGPVNVFTVGSTNLYHGYIVGAAYHNPTTLFAKPFAVGLFILVAARLTRARGAPLAGSAFVSVTALTVLACIAKPSLPIALIPAALLLALWWRRDLVRHLLLACAVPAAAVLWWQHAVLAGGELGGGIAWAPLDVLGTYSDHLGVKLVLSLLFPLAVVGLCRGALDDMGLRLAWLTFIVAALPLYLLAETGPRADDGNFAWGAQLAVLVLYLASARVVLERVARGQVDRRSVSLVLTAAALHLLGGALLWSVYASGTSDLGWL